MDILSKEENNNKPSIVNMVENKKIDRAKELFNSMSKELKSKLGDSYLNNDIYDGMKKENRIEIMAYFLSIKFEQHLPTTKILAKLVLEDYEKNIETIEDNLKIDENEKRKLLNSKENPLLKEHDAKDTAIAMKELNQSKSLDFT